MSVSKVVWKPQPRQAAFMARPEYEALYGGAAGGGKSDALVIEALRQVHIPWYKALILRKTFPQLRELIDKTLNYYPRIYPKAKYNGSSHTWRFPSGAQIIFGSLNRPQDKIQYQGQAYDFIAFDELTHFTQEEYEYLKSRNRPNGPGTRVYMRATANPGGVGHGWVKDRFITASAPMTTIREEASWVDPEGKKHTGEQSRIFVPSSVFDNQILMQNDPMYVQRLASMPEAERNALLYGDWDSFSGQVFTVGATTRPIIRTALGATSSIPLPCRPTGASGAGWTGGTPGRFPWGGTPWTMSGGCMPSGSITAARGHPTRASSWSRERWPGGSGRSRPMIPTSGARGSTGSGTRPSG